MTSDQADRIIKLLTSIDISLWVLIIAVGFLIGFYARKELKK